ncbi:hypothetical protein I302_101750 [Kwoniella bestiolae CBS 10118]|uniref:Uncharacterized protein n=1 Tax=Kwoniella bestiolae CBS 10118 TaxID=1296100 RepID=A0A1B9GD63_9TREE|nr:hypothetical protein I302_00427 [Kwoniella bestiolae CBS 10118]OCF28937.1 hypothetical protein I302_00427 [Kwoniella bestiolae CBS 10118]
MITPILFKHVICNGPQLKALFQPLLSDFTSPTEEGSWIVEEPIIKSMLDTRDTTRIIRNLSSVEHLTIIQEKGEHRSIKESEPSDHFMTVVSSVEILSGKKLLHKLEKISLNLRDNEEESRYILKVLNEISAPKHLCMRDLDTLGNYHIHPLYLRWPDLARSLFTQPTYHDVATCLPTVNLPLPNLHDDKDHPGRGREQETPIIRMSLRRHGCDDDCKMILSHITYEGGCDKAYRSQQMKMLFDLAGECISDGSIPDRLRWEIIQGTQSEISLDQDQLEKLREDLMAALNMSDDEEDTFEGWSQADLQEKDEFAKKFRGWFDKLQWVMGDDVRGQPCC